MLVVVDTNVEVLEQTTVHFVEEAVQEGSRWIVPVDLALSVFGAQARLALVVGLALRVGGGRGFEHCFVALAVEALHVIPEFVRNFFLVDGIAAAGGVVLVIL